MNNISDSLTLDEIKAGLRLKADGGNSFAADLLSNHARWGKWSPKQAEWAVKMAREALARDGNDIAGVTRKADFKGDFESLIISFNTAKENGLKRPKITLEKGFGTMVISAAPNNGRNKGFLYVKVDDIYMGKVSPLGEFFSVSECTWDVKEYLALFAGSIETEAAIYGKETGCCCFCNRELTDERSVTVGYGPVCASKFNLPYGE